MAAGIGGHECLCRRGISIQSDCVIDICIDFPKKVPVSVPYYSKGSHVFAPKWWSHAVWHDWPWRRSVWFSRFTPEKPLGIINDSPHLPPSSVGEEGRSDSSGSCRLVGTTSTATDWS